jgi:hypothetical protein
MNISAQIEDIKMTNDSSLIIEKVYLGGLGYSSFSTDSLYVQNTAQLRVGAAVRYKINKMLRINSCFIYQAETITSWVKTQFSLAFTPSEKFIFQVGNMGTISTEQRPHPVSSGGQFETWTEAQIPGGALGAKMTIAPSKDFSFGMGVAVRKQQPEYHANISFKKLTLSGYYCEYDKKAGAALKYKGTRVWSTLIWKQDKVIANMFGCKPFKNYNLSIYSDMGYNLETNKLVRGEWGIYKTYNYVKRINVTPCLGYNHETKTIRGYLFLFF